MTGRLFKEVVLAAGILLVVASSGCLSASDDGTSIVLYAFSAMDDVMK